MRRREPKFGAAVSVDPLGPLAAGNFSFGREVGSVFNHKFSEDNWHKTGVGANQSMV